MPRKNKYRYQDWIAMRIAARYNMVEEYKIARRHGRSPLQALEEWDLLTEENMKLIFDKSR
ncbi:MAG: hypothetical protein K5867_07020 [Bacteroidales bacterium]|nr:hypothetical protein [Bacteroidales bacterium]